MENIKNKELIERKHFIMRSFEHGNLDKVSYEKELVELDKKINMNLQEFLASIKPEIEKKFAEVSAVIKFDGEKKKSDMIILTEFLSQYFTKDEIKGIYRAGYKHMRE